jgi:chromate reductase, NAD(P)H dehydrogenase (quinone)
MVTDFTRDNADKSRLISNGVNIIGISGSLRTKSYNTALLRAAQKLAPEGMSIEILPCDGLPVYNQDIEESDFPAIVRDLCEKIVKADGVIIAVPENNRVPSSALTNFLTWTSRPENEPNPWDGKPVAIFGVSSGPRGASFAQYDIRRVMGYFNARVMGQPEIYVGPANDKFDADQNLTDERTGKSVAKFLATFKNFCEQTASPLS